MSKFVSGYLSSPCYGSNSLREIDQDTTDFLEITGFDLMERAGSASFHFLQNHWPSADRIVVLCGTGNNGGDGWILARLALNCGFKCKVFLMGSSDQLAGPSLRAFENWQTVSQRPASHISFFEHLDLNNVDLVIDALVGTGFRPKGTTDLSKIAAKLNESPVSVLAIDMPSGLDSDTGAVCSSTIRADRTITFLAHKPGLLTGPALDYVGIVSLASLGVPDLALKRDDAKANRVSKPEFASMPLRKRDPSGHKGCFGHVLVVGGNVGMGGAAILAAYSALRAGAGLVTLATLSAHIPPTLSRHPEIMTACIDDATQLEPLLSRTSVIVIGPGLGQDHWSRSCLEIILDSELPLILDADALNLFSMIDWPLLEKRPTIITPHPGEASGLLGCKVSDVEADRVKTARLLSEITFSTVMLKGAGTIIFDKDCAYPAQICCDGNPGMATAGMGDVLAGLTGSLLAQGLTTFEAAFWSAAAHARAGDQAWSLQGNGLIASDVAELLGSIIFLS